MLAYVDRRLIQTALILLGVSFITFLLLYVLPADPVRQIAGRSATAETVESLRRQLGLDQPFLVQYGRYLWNLAQGDFGRSYLQKTEVADLLVSRLPATLLLMVAAILCELPDFRVAKQNGVGSLTLVDKQGRFIAEVTDFAGEYVKEQYYTEEEKEAERKKQGGEKYLSVDDRIVIKLKKERKAFKSERYEHNYHCWRTDKPVLYYPLDSWFIRTTALKDRMAELNTTINWKPESTGTGRFGNWLENLVDWNLSRSRYWGIPLPIWRSEDAQEELCIGSIEQLREEMKKSIAAGFMDAKHLEHIDPAQPDFDLHRPYVDNIVLVSPTGKKMFREADLIDVWFDSGAIGVAAAARRCHPHR